MMEDDLSGAKTIYLLASGVLVEVSRDGAEFKPLILRQQLQFAGPAETTDTQLVFVDGPRRVRVNHVRAIDIWGVERCDEVQPRAPRTRFSAAWSIRHGESRPTLAASSRTLA